MVFVIFTLLTNVSEYVFKKLNMQIRRQLSGSCSCGINSLCYAQVVRRGEIMQTDRNTFEPTEGQKRLLEQIAQQHEYPGELRFAQCNLSFEMEEFVNKTPVPTLTVKITLTHAEGFKGVLNTFSENCSELRKKIANLFDEKYVLNDSEVLSGDQFFHHKKLILWFSLTAKDAS